MINPQSFTTAELRGILKATVQTVGENSEMAIVVRKELQTRGAGERTVNDFIDRQSLIYLVGTIFVALGAWRRFGDGFCFMVGGVLLILPILVPLIPRRPIVTVDSGEGRPRK